MLLNQNKSSLLRAGLACFCGVFFNAALQAGEDCEAKMLRIYHGAKKDLWASIDPVKSNDFKIMNIVYASHKIAEHEWNINDHSNKKLKEFRTLYHYLRFPQHDWVYATSAHIPQAVMISPNELAKYMVEASHLGLLCPRKNRSGVFLKAVELRQSIRDATLQSQVTYLLDEDKRRQKELEQAKEIEEALENDKLEKEENPQEYREDVFFFADEERKVKEWQARIGPSH